MALSTIVVGKNSGGMNLFIFRGEESHPRSFVKAISWRVLGSLDTFILSLIITGDIRAAGAIASIETLTKIVLYYLHERAWSAVPWGRQQALCLGDKSNVTESGEQAVQATS